MTFYSSTMKILISGIDFTPSNDVNIKMTMTTQGCPLHDQ